MTTATKPPIAANLRELKSRRGCTAREIALAVDVGERSVQMWLSDDGSEPSWPNVVALAAYFDVRPAYFYDDHEPARDEQEARSTRCPTS